jgi:thiol-disulfide isomerase/thioredoxin
MGALFRALLEKAISKQVFEILEQIFDLADCLSAKPRTPLASLMKAIFYPSLFAALVIPSIAAPGAAAESPKLEVKKEAQPGDEAWKALEAMFKGPAKNPTSREEAIELFKTHLKSLDEKASSFRKDFPADARRWKLAIEEVKSNSIRKAVGMPAKDEAAVAKLLGEILAAPDADAETRSFASFIRVNEMAGALENGTVTLADFEKAVNDHTAAFPDFKMNSRLLDTVKGQKALSDLKTKPFDLKFTAVDGSEVDFAKLRGKVVLIDFWATWCGPCVAELPHVLEAYKKLHDKGFEIVGISLDKDKKKLETFTKEKGMTWPQHFDGQGWQNEISSKFGIKSIPAMWMLDKKGMLVSTNAREDLAGKVEKYLAE